MKMPLTKYYCMSKECGWEETSHKLLDGVKCPKCSGPVNSERIRGELEYRHKAECLVCEHNEMVYHESKEDYQEVRVCPKCNGAFVDVFKICKYEKVQLVTEKENITGKLERVFYKACESYLKRPGIHTEELSQIRQLGEVLIHSKNQQVFQGVTIKIPSDSKQVNGIINEITKKLKESLGRMGK